MFESTICVVSSFPTRGSCYWWFMQCINPPRAIYVSHMCASFSSILLWLGIMVGEVVSLNCNILGFVKKRLLSEMLINSWIMNSLRHRYAQNCFMKGFSYSNIAKTTAREILENTLKYLVDLYISSESNSVKSQPLARQNNQCSSYLYRYLRQCTLFRFNQVRDKWNCWNWWK